MPTKEKVIYTVNGTDIEPRHVPRLFEIIEHYTGLDKLMIDHIFAMGNPIKHPEFTVTMRKV